MSIDYMDVTIAAGSAVSGTVQLLNRKPVALITPAIWEGTTTEGTVAFATFEAADGAGGWADVLSTEGTDPYKLNYIMPDAFIARFDDAFALLRGDIRMTLKYTVDGTDADAEQTAGATFRMAVL